MAGELFQAKAHQVKKRQQKPQTLATVNAAAPRKAAEKKKTPKAAKKVEQLTQVKHKEQSTEKKATKKSHEKKHHTGSHKHHKKSFDELVQENEQLDNLFLTVRDDLLEKPKAHAKKPSKASFVQLDHKSRQKDEDLTVDEQAEKTLKSMAHSMTTEQKREDESFKSPTDVSMVLNHQK